MQAIIFSRFGSSKVLALHDLQIPSPTPEQVLVKTYAAGLNPIDYKIRNGTSFVCEQLQFPSGLGYELAGEIVAVGDTIKHLSVGDPVFGLAGFPMQPNCYAEYVCTKPDKLITKPTSLTWLEASGITIAGLTALQAIELAAIQKDNCVLIHAGAGGVGHLTVQLAKQLGAVVITTASAANHQFLQTLGADHCIDYQTQDFTKLISQVDAVIDLVGGETGVRSLPLLKKGGKLITIPTATRDQVLAAAENLPVSATGLLMQFNPTQLAKLADGIQQNSITLEIGRTFPLSQVQLAHQLLESHRARGKSMLNTQL